MTARPDMDLDSWVAMLDQVYSPTKNYERTEYQLYARLVEQFAGISKFAAKRPDRSLLGEALAKAFSWLVAVCIKTGNADLGELVWHKFPGVCAYCAHEKCQCGGEKKSAE